MDINEAFRPEDLSKTDFFDFVTAPDIGLDIGVNDSNNHTSGSNNVNRHSESNQTLEVYEQFWNSEKPDRLESEIFEDIDRFCWQQHQQNHNLLAETSSNVSSTANSSTPSNIIHRLQETGHMKVQNNCGNNIASCKNLNNNNGLTCLSTDENLSSTNININASDSHVYTLTVLNGNESWLKRSEAIVTDAHLAPCLDLDSLLGTFPPYVKSEFVYEDSGFCPTDGTSINDNSQTTSTNKNALSVVAESISKNNESIENVKVNNEILGTTKPLDAITNASIQTISNNSNTTDLQNNNNDWHMTDNNNIIQQDSAESLLRSALQGKGYAKGLHLQNGISLMSSNSIKEDFRSVLFSEETVCAKELNSLPFADSTLTNSIFEENQSQSVLTPARNNSGNINNQNNDQNHSSSSTGIIVDDMFLSLDSAFTEDFERIKKIATEVQHFVTGSDYSTEIIMEVAAAAAAAAAAASVPTCENTMDNSLRSGNAIQIIHQQSLLPRTQNQESKHSNIIASLNEKINTTSIKPPTKKLKRNSLIISNNNSSNCNDNNIDANLMNTKANSNNKNCDNLNQNNSNYNNNRTSPVHCNGQRKERSLHYCSICSKGFKDKYSVNVHIRTHTGEKPFACTLCGKSFRQKAHLAKHYQTHLAQKGNGGLAKNSKNSSSNRLANNQLLNNNTNSSSTINSSGSLRKARQLSPITTIADVNSSISLSEANNHNIPNSLTINNVPLPSLPATGILANR